MTCMHLSSASTRTNDCEVDAPWFDADWLAEHPDFPMAANTTDFGVLDDTQAITAVA